MKILLIRPNAPLKAPFSTTERRAPIGIAYLIAVLRKAKHEVKFIDMYIGECCTGEQIAEFNPDFVGMYTDTITFDEALYSLKILNMIRKEPNINYKIIVGGPHATLRPQDIPEFVDYIVQGEGEQAILDIITEYPDDCSVPKIIKREYIEDLDSLPMPDYDELYYHDYDWAAPELEAQAVAVMSTSRGCPFTCKFCSSWKLWGKRYRWMNAEKIIEHIKYLKEKHNIDGVYFREDNFIANKERTKKFCELVKPLGIKWKCEARINNLKPEVIEMIADAGCRALYIGVESGSQKVLDLMNKCIKVEDFKPVFDKCREVGIKAYASIIIGFPGETEEDRVKTHIMLERAKPYHTWWNIFSGLPGSETYDEMTEYYEGKYGMKYPLYWNIFADQYYGQGIPWRINKYNCKKVIKNA